MRGEAGDSFVCWPASAILFLSLSVKLLTFNSIKPGFIRSRGGEERRGEERGGEDFNEKQNIYWNSKFRPKIGIRKLT